MTQSLRKALVIIPFCALGAVSFAENHDPVDNPFRPSQHYIVETTNFKGEASPDRIDFRLLGGKLCILVDGRQKSCYAVTDENEGLMAFRLLRLKKVEAKRRKLPLIIGDTLGVGFPFKISKSSDVSEVLMQVLVKGNEDEIDEYSVSGGEFTSGVHLDPNRLKMEVEPNLEVLPDGFKARVVKLYYVNHLGGGNVEKFEIGRTYWNPAHSDWMQKDLTRFEILKEAAANLGSSLHFDYGNAATGVGGFTTQPSRAPLRISKVPMVVSKWAEGR